MLVDFDRFQNSDLNGNVAFPVIDKEFLQLFDYWVNIPKFRYGNAEYSCYTRLVKLGDNAVNEIKRYLESLKPRKSVLYQLLKNETHMIVRMAHVEPLTESAIENSCSTYTLQCSKEVFHVKNIQRYSASVKC